MPHVTSTARLLRAIGQVGRSVYQSPTLLVALRGFHDHQFPLDPERVLIEVFWLFIEFPIDLLAGYLEIAWTRSISVAVVAVA